MICNGKFRCCTSTSSTEKHFNFPTLVTWRSFLTSRAWALETPQVRGWGCWWQATVAHHRSSGSISRDRPLDPIPDDKSAVQFEWQIWIYPVGRVSQAVSWSQIQIGRFFANHQYPTTNVAMEFFYHQKTTSTLMGPGITVPARYSLVFLRVTKHGGRETRWDLQMAIARKLRNILPWCQRVICSLGICGHR